MYHYEYKNNLYYLIDDRGEVITISKKAALCFTYNLEDGGVLHKHGSPENVNKWAIKTRKKFMEASENLELHKHLTGIGTPTTGDCYSQMANEIVVIEGKFPVKELQKCIDIPDYVGVFYKRLQKDGYET